MSDSDQMLHYFMNIFPTISSITYKQAIFILKDITSIRKSSNLRHFWSLCNILWNSENTNDQTRFSEWLLEVSNASIPLNTDPFLSALFTHNINEIHNQASFIDPMFPLLLTAPTNSFDFQVLNVPPFLEKRTFQFGKIKISGSSIWSLLCGSISELSKYDLDWSLLFTLHFWYAFHGTDFQSGFLSYTSTQKIKDNKFDLDPIYLTLSFYFMNSSSSLFQIASILPPLDAFAFMIIISKIQTDSKIIQIISDIFSSLTKPLASQLTNLGHPEIATGLLYNSNFDSELQTALRRTVTASKDFSAEEEYLIHNFKISIMSIINAKADKCMYLANTVTDPHVQLKMYSDSIRLLVQVNRIQDAENIYSENYIPLMSEFGAGDMEAGELAAIIDEASKGEAGDTVKIMLIMRKVLNHKEDVTEAELVFAGKAMENNWGTFALRRDLCNLLLTSPLAYKYLKKVDAAPKAQLIAYSI